MVDDGITGTNSLQSWRGDAEGQGFAAAPPAWHPQLPAPGLGFFRRAPLPAMDPHPMDALWRPFSRGHCHWGCWLQTPPARHNAGGTRRSGSIAFTAAPAPTSQASDKLDLPPGISWHSRHQGRSLEVGIWRLVPLPRREEPRKVAFSYLVPSCPNSVVLT